MVTSKKTEKMKVITILMLGLLYCQFSAVNAQKGEKPKGSFKLRQSFQSENTKPEPATITYTKPKSEKESFLVDAALGYTFPANSRRTVTAYSEYHRNTLVDEKSNTLQFGFAYEHFTNDSFLIDDQPKNYRTTVINVNGKYSNDMVKKIESAQLSGEITLVRGRQPKSRAFLPNAWNEFGKNLAVIYYPSVGIEWESRLKTENDSAKGSIGRVSGKLYVSIFPFAAAVKDRIELFANTAMRYDVINTTLYDDRTHPSIETGVNFILSKSKPKASIGISYNNIDDPGSGKEHQDFWLVALKVKL